MSTTTITPLFGAPVYQINLESELNMNELTSIMDASGINNVDKLETNTGNKFTSEQYFLNKHEDTVFYKTIKKHLNIYFHNILMASDEIELYLTQSWLNRNEPGEYHHAHTHPNSYISGTFYYKVNESTGNFVLADTKYTPIEFQKKEFNIFNSNSWKFTPAQYELFLFPSSIMHHVEINKSNISRISLAFNTFMRGIINRGSTTGLILK
jgi:uncharacterized protein (TIGR02466 family)